MSDILKAEIQKLLSQNSKRFEIAPNKIPLSAPTYGIDEIMESIDCLISSDTTMGKKVLAFENQFASYIGAKHAVMVNSGSSANFLAISSLMSSHYPSHLKPGDEVIVPAVTWPTTVYPFIQLGLKVAFADCEEGTFNISAEAIEKLIRPETKAVCIVPVLGNPCDMAKIVALCKKHNLLLIEDTCESLGSSFNGKKCGSFGKVGTFSFFFSHHITTMEGGMIVTDDDTLVDILRSQRAHGWVRGHSRSDLLKQKHKDIDPRFLFIDVGFNFRPMEIQGAFGMHQLKKLPAMNDKRRHLASLILSGLKKHKHWLQLPQEQENGHHTWFGFPFLVLPESGVTRNTLMSFLESHGIETRPIIGGNLTKQPVFQDTQGTAWRKSDELIHAQKIHDYGIYFGTHSGMSPDHCEHVIKIFDLFAKSHLK
jgi:CDP-6-deoxy-D-xylo-4-hexulose-3-dehydrase